MRESPILTAVVVQLRRWDGVVPVQPICDASTNTIQVVATGAIGTALKLSITDSVSKYTNV
jgi:hypothetical protein